MKVWTESITIDVVVVAENKQRAQAAVVDAVRQHVTDDEKMSVKHVVRAEDLPESVGWDDKPLNGDKPISEYISSADIMKESMS